jgi:hypothetical protein
MELYYSVNVTREQVETALQDDDWTLGNNVLYQLCETYPDHQQVNAVVAKIWLIGRAYAAAIERRKNQKGDAFIVSDLFYIEQVAPALINSNLDRYITDLRHYSDIDDQNLEIILRLHKHLVVILEAITHDNKRSLASKYLHFHLPNLFYIYDSRASNALLKYMPRYKTKRYLRGEFDAYYNSFFLKMLDFREWIQNSYGIALTPRQLDRLLLSKK